ncbi:MAG TPA: hypothetical protein VFN01_05365 [Marinobacter sp.]|uniref:hypothetical protein n=1 Tax=Marinobacter sp. TaxID=50741 RepID=UPI00260C6479|nr:hypothetical protein [Marinobacter sp.]HET8800597.1 hypothetical protein [Marinobacter sp.]
MPSRIDLTLSPSVAVGLLATVPWLAAGAFALLAAASGKPWLALAVPPMLAGALIQYRQNGRLSGRKAVQQLILDEGQLYARLGDNRLVTVTTGGASRIGSRLALLKLRPTGTRFQSYPVILLSGTPFGSNVPDDPFRRLRLWLRLGRPETSVP